MLPINRLQYWPLFFAFCSPFSLVFCQKSEKTLAGAAPFHAMYQAQPPIVRQDLSTLPAIINADQVSKMLRKVANEEMGVVAMQSMLDTMLYKNREFDHMTSVRKLAVSLDKKLSNFRSVLETNAKEIVSSYKKTPYDVQVFKQYRECCALNDQNLKHISQYPTKVNLSQTCDIVPRALSHFSFYPGKELVKDFEANSRAHSSLLWQYFTSYDGLHVEYPAHKLDDGNFTNCVRLGHERHRSIFIKTALPFKKRVVILIDHGNVMSFSQLETAKCVTKALISALDDNDEVLVLAVGSDVVYPTHLHCTDEKLFRATVDVKEHLYAFVDGIVKAPGHTNHSLGFGEAFKTLKDASADDNVKPIILYVSRGLFSQLTEGSYVMAKIAEANLKMENAVQINTFALMDTGKAVMWETTFLRDVAAQNFQQYSQSFPVDLLKIVKSKLRPPEGKMISINSSIDYCISLKEIYESLKPSGFVVEEDSFDGDGLKFSFNHDSLDLFTLSVSKGVVQSDQFLGIVGVDSRLKDFASPVLYFSSPDTTSYAFLVDLTGKTLVHPKLNNLMYEKVSPVDVNILERLSPREVGFKSSIFSEKEGVQAVTFDENNQNVTSTKSYYWKKLANGPLVVVVASSEDKLIERSEKVEKKVGSTNVLTYHRLDLRLNKDLRVCQQGKLLANTERCGLYLSPKCFEKPFERSLMNEDLRMAQGYWAYVSDLTKLITNPGLKSELIRNEIADWSRIAGDWRKQSRTSSLKSIIVRRYLATPSGILLTYPALFMDQSYDPTQRHWYQRALQYPGKITLTQPTLDASGVGYVVSLSTTVFEGKAAALHHPGDPVVAVMAIDVPLTFLFKLVEEASSLCRESKNSCFLFNDRGYVVAHRNSYVESVDATTQPYEKMHITHKEAAIASDILQKKDFVKKMLCNNYGGKSVQRYYVVNTSYSDVLRSGEGCMRYQVVAVPNTNVFLAIVNRSCNRQSSFCPCSVVDRKCLNCHRAEPSECECPCECPTKGLHCDDSELDFSSYPPCEPLESELKTPTPDAGFPSSTVQSCFDVNCGDFTTESQCLGAIGCEWCILEDRKTYLAKPFCSTVNQCYGGVVGYSPYGALEKSYPNEQFVSSTPVGPVAGGIIGVFVILVLLVFLYRQRVVRFVEGRGGRYNSAGSGSRLNANDECQDEFLFDDGSGVKGDGRENQGNCLFLASFEHDLPAPVRPRPAWRHGPRTESSDPGYSTMTGNCDDSEQATTIEPLSPRRYSDGKSVFLGRPRPRSFCSTAATIAASEPAAANSDIETFSPTLLTKASEVKERLLKETYVDTPPPGQTMLPGESQHIVTTALIHAVDT